MKVAGIVLIIGGALGIAWAIMPPIVPDTSSTVNLGTLAGTANTIAVSDTMLLCGVVLLAAGTLADASPKSPARTTRHNRGRTSADYAELVRQRTPTTRWTSSIGNHGEAPFPLGDGAFP